MKKERLLLLLLAAALTLSGCGAASESGTVSNFAESSVSSGDYNDAAYTGDDLYSYKKGDASADTEEASSDSGDTYQSAVEETGTKLVVTASYSVETKDLDALLATVKTKTKDLGGYIESSNISNGYTDTPEDDPGIVYYSSEDSRTYTSNSRYATLVVRIPADQLDAFTADALQGTNITDQSTTTDDITLQYVDTKSQIDALKTEQENLISMMDKAESVDDLIQIENALTDVRSQLQSLESQKKVMDNQVAYSTVNLDITETTEYTVSEENLTFGERLKRGFADSASSFALHMKNLALGFLSNLPMILYWIIIIAIVIAVLRILVQILKAVFGRRKNKKPSEKKHHRWGKHRNDAAKDGPAAKTENVPENTAQEEKKES